MVFLHRHRKLKRLPFKCHCHHGESTVHWPTKNTSPSKRSSPDINSRSSSQHGKKFYFYV